MQEDAALWQEFAAESEEHLDAIEALLSAGAGVTDRAGVDRLFRAFHSLKGMSDALGAPGMKGVAHRCEDLLGQARAGRLAVEGEVAEALLTAVDALRRQRAQVIGTHRDAPAPAPLLARLSAALADPGRGAMAAAPAEMAPADVMPAELAAEGASAPLLLSLASRSRAAAGGLAALALGPEPAALAEAEELAGAAGLLGLPRLASALRGLAGAAGGAGALPALGLVRRKLILLEEACGEPAGAEELAAGASVLASGLAPRLGALALQLDALTAGGDAPATADAAREAAAAACACGLEALETLLLTLEDLADRAAEPDAAAVLATQGPGLADRLRSAAEGGIAALRAPLALSEAGPAADPRLPPGFAAALGPEARRRALAALEAGRALYRARLAIGAPPEAEAALGAFLRAETEVLASRSALDGQPPHLDLLLAATPDLEALSRGVTAADPARRVLLDLAPAEPGGEPEPAPTRAAAAVTMRVRQETIDTIIALQGEVRAAALALSDRLGEGGAARALSGLSALERRLPEGAAREMASALDALRAGQEGLERAESRLTRGLRRLDEAVMELRVVPIGALFARLPRVVRAVARAGGKEVELVLEGEDVTIDRSLVELLADPLLHLTRNAVDHGVEPPAGRAASGKPARAVLRISAARRIGQIRLRVSDDGRGIDRDLVLARAVERGIATAEEAAAMGEEEVHALLFRPGFSTAEAVTETSGRGVGLDVVQEAIRRAGGTLEVASRPGEGTSFTLRLPLSAAVQPVLLVEVGGHPYALPAGRVEAVLQAGEDPGCEVLDLRAVLGLPGAAEPGAVVLLRSGGRLLGLAVGRVQRRTDLLLRPMHPALAALPGLGGVGVLGNGEPVVVLEPDGMVAGG